MAAIFSCLDPILPFVSTIAYKDPFYTPLGKEANVDQVWDGFDRGCQSDHLMIIQAFDMPGGSLLTATSSPTETSSPTMF